jgi:hypothetical protein
MPTPPPFQYHSPTSQLIASKLCPLSPSSITEPSSPSGDPNLRSAFHTPNSTPKDSEYNLLVEEKEEVLRKNVLLQKRLDEVMEMQETTSKRLIEVEQQLHKALEEVDRVRAFMKKEGKRLIRGI